MRPGAARSWPQWLTEIGAANSSEESEACGIFYSSRFYRLLDGVEPPPIEGPIGADLGYMKYAIFPGDSRIFSVTLAACAGRQGAACGLCVPKPFAPPQNRCPPRAPWVDPAVSEPHHQGLRLSRISTAAAAFFVKDDTPLALGIFPIGDALVHQNPLSGRGCTLGWLAAWHLAEAWE